MDIQSEKILKTKSITEYLTLRGHHPVKELGHGRKSYLCPFDDHKETKPSFVVYAGQDYENFFCFGCNRGFSIIHLVSFIEHISYSDAVNRLSDGSVIPTEDEIKYLIEKINKQFTNKNPIVELSKTFLKSSWQCLLYSQGINFDSEEIKIIDRYYNYIDEKIIEGDFNIAEESIGCLSDILIKRKTKYQKTLELRRKQEFSEDDIIC